MNTVFITGASGFIGKHLSLTLANQGNLVHALVRKTSVSDGLNHPNITLFDGDLLDKKSIVKAMQGCNQVYHLAGLARMWAKDKKLYYEVNVTGTKNVLEAARDLRVQKIVATSTAGVFPPAVGKPSQELTKKIPNLFTNYERTKNESEELAAGFAKEGLPVVIVNPTKVFGPGLVDDSNSATLMIRNYINGTWKIIPGSGRGTMNYVYIDDAVQGMMLAMEKAAVGSQYILGGENASYETFFSIIKEEARTKRWLVHVPYIFIRSIALLEDAKSKLFNIRPLITTEWVRKLPFDWSKDITKAKTELGFQPMSLREGIQKTIAWLHETKQIK